MKGENSAIQAIDQSESVEEIRKLLTEARKRLKAMPDNSIPVDRARVLLDVAELQLGIGQGAEAWQHARESFSVFIDYEHWQDAVEAADILYQCGHKEISFTSAATRIRSVRWPRASGWR